MQESAPPPRPVPPPDRLAQLPPPPSGRTGFPWTVAAPPLPALAPGQVWPRLTIVTPSYNQAAYLEETLRSVLLQGYPQLEYFVRDGGSTDGSVAIIERYAPWLSGWVSAPDRGQSDALNQGFALATGEFIAWLNSDDTYTAGALTDAAQQLLAHPEAVVVHGEANLIARDSRWIGKALARPYDRQWLLEQANSVPQPSAFIRRAAFEQVGRLDESLHFAMDYDLWLRLGQVGPVVYVPAVLSNQRIYADAKTSSGDARHYAEVRAVIQKHGGPGLPVGFGEWLARIHLPLAWQAFARGDAEAGQAELAFVLQNVPAWRRAPQLAAEVAERAWALDLGLAGRDEPALAFVERVSRHLPAEVERPQTVRPLALAAVHTAAAFRHAARGEGPDVWRHVVRAWAHAPRRLANAGLWAIARRALGQRPPTAPFSLDPVRQRLLGWLTSQGLLPLPEGVVRPAEAIPALRLAALWDAETEWPTAHRRATAAALAASLAGAPADLNAWPPLRETLFALATAGVVSQELAALALPFEATPVRDQWLAALDWAQPRSASSRVADLAAALRDRHQQMPSADTVAALRQLYEWVAAHHHTDSGSWTFGHDIPRVEALISAAHLLPLYQAVGQPLPDPEPLIESILALQGLNGLFGAGGRGDVYADARLLQLLAHLSRATDYRAAEVRLAARLAGQTLLRRQHPDGGFGGAPLDWLTTGRPATAPTAAPATSDTWSAWLSSLALAAIVTRWPELAAPTVGWTLAGPPELAGLQGASPA